LGLAEQHGLRSWQLQWDRRAFGIPRARLSVRQATAGLCPRLGDDRPDPGVLLGSESALSKATLTRRTTACPG
jgi:hypothetical protein